MAFYGRLWPDVDQGNRFPYTYDFKGRLPTSDTIVDTGDDIPVWELKVEPEGLYDGVDPRDLSTLITDTTINNTNGNKVTAWVEDLVPGVRYKLVAFITSAAGVKDDLYSFIRCNPTP